MKRIFSGFLAFVVLLNLTSYGKIKDVKSELTDPNLEYSLSEIERLSAEEMHILDYELPALYKYYEGKLKIGVSCGGHEYEDYETDDVANGIMKNYNVYVLGNELKSDYCNPSEGVYNFSAGDGLVNNAKYGNAELRGHTIVWHNQMPQWWFKADPNDPTTVEECYQNGTLATAEQLKERLRTYIFELIPHFKDSIKYWDVWQRGSERYRKRSSPGSGRLILGGHLLRRGRRRLL